MTNNILKSLKRGDIVEIPYIIDDGGDGAAICEILYVRDPFVEVKVLETEECLLVDEETEYHEI